MQEKELQLHIAPFFGKLFDLKAQGETHEILQGIPRLVSEEMNHSLTRPVSMEEIKEAIFSMHPMKSPGPDGLTSRFYQKNWELVKGSIF